ncbi:MAG TPA: Hsp70 family protein [Thermosynechococcus sp. M3746_W2019_013]|uniref:Hsp70 family protein n=1 Tax=Thermosynechococcus sp. M3746_W2019_013 TaxID=2747806 RepID=UPI001A0DE84C|nr:Hsp70 family protein [Thermosynechococcus sp. M3746_W2019_013]HIK23261.1 Hsp70 family protein [Thermosynechococcus sp. M3746_W2019_013]
MTYAIDFGTSNTLVARWNSAAQAAEAVTLPGRSVGFGEVPALVPSLVYVEDASVPLVVVGQQVRDRGLDVVGDRRFFSRFKRGIGTTVQGYLPELDGCSLSFETIGTWFLQALVQELKPTGGGDVEQGLIFTVPVDSFETYRRWLWQVCERLALQQIRLLDEPTAAALGYGVADRPLILVIDFGGGTLDLSLVELKTNQRQSSPLGFILKWGDRQWAASDNQRPRTARVIAKAGLNLGGTDIDHWIVDEWVKRGLPANSLLLRLAERLKIQLSQQPYAQQVYFDSETFTTLELRLERPELEEILRQQQFFQRLDNALTQVLQQARRQGITPDTIDAVLLVGGTTQMPAVQKWVAEYFDPAKISGQHPFTAVAMGALAVTQGLELKDFLYHSYGIRFWDAKLNRHGWHPIIQRGQPYPMAEPVELILGASTEGQPSIELVIGELGDEQGGVEIFFDGDRLITRSVGEQTVQPLNDTPQGKTLARLDPPGYPGSDRIRVLLQVDGDRQLRVTVDDLLTQERLINNQIVTQLR